MKNYKRLLLMLKKKKKALFIGSIFLIAASGTNLAVPLYIRNLVDTVMVEKNLDHLNTIAVIIGLLFLIQLVCQTIHNYLFDVTEKRVIADFRIKLFNHLHKMSVSYFVKRRT